MDKDKDIKRLKVTNLSDRVQYFKEPIQVGVVEYCIRKTLYQMKLFSIKNIITKVKLFIDTTLGFCILMLSSLIIIAFVISCILVCFGFGEFRWS